MTPSSLKKIGIACFVLCGVLLFVAIERYRSNANNVAAFNHLAQSSPIGSMAGAWPFGGATTGGRLTPGTPAATTYALLFAALSGIGGVVCFILAAKDDSGGAAKPHD